LVIPSPYFVSRGFSPEVLDVMDVGHSRKRRRTVVPIYGETGDACVGYLERSEKPRCQSCGMCHDPGGDCRYGEPRWGVMAGFPKASYLYNHSALHSEHQYVYLVEGVGEVWKLAEAGHPAVAMLGTELSNEQADKLARAGKQVIIAPDNDHAGKTSRSAVEKKLLERNVFTSVRFPPDPYKDLGEMPAAEVVRWAKCRWLTREEAARLREQYSLKRAGTAVPEVMLDSHAGTA
jgi:hypothetical protein